MKKLITFILFFVLVFSSSLKSQTLAQIEDEANPKINNKVDNSPFAVKMKQLVELRKQGNSYLEKILVNQIMTEFPEKFTGSPAKSDVLISERSKRNNQIPYVLPQEPDWGSGDVLVYPGLVAAALTGNPTPFNKSIRLRADTLGNLYIGFLNANRDTLAFLRSTNQGSNWSIVDRIWSGADTKYHSFDFFITDSLSFQRIGTIVSLISASGSGYDGSIYFGSENTDGTGFYSTIIQAGIAGVKGFIGPAIVSDGFKWSATSTYWYATYQGVNPTTGAGTIAYLDLSMNWGRTWLIDTARNTYNDYDLDIEYNYNADTIYVLMTNNLTTTNPNLRLRYVALSNIGTNVSVSQYNPASTSAPEFDGCLAVNRQTNEMVVTYTATNATNDILYAYTATGSFPMTLAMPLASGTNSETNCQIDCQERQGAYRIAFTSFGTGRDTVKYSSTFTLSTGFTSFTTVNADKNCAGTLVPSIAGYRSSASGFGGGIAFSGITTVPQRVFFDGSGISPITGVIGNQNIPSDYELKQNFPNPFNPSTTINYSIKENNFVSLKVYDMTGKVVAELVGKNQIAGNYSAIFNASNFSSGIYFYKLTSGNFSETKKMLLVK